MNSNWIPPFQLKVFDATSCICCFGSEFPHWLQIQKALVDLRLSNTSLSISSIPTLFTPQNLTILNLAYNQIMGTLPTTIDDQMPKLEMLFLSDNLINGFLPPSICKLKNLKILDECFIGCLLTPILHFLDLSSNNFSGIFPYSHENMTDIRKVYLRDDNFEGSMPIVLKNATRLEILELTENKFTGNIPTWLETILTVCNF